MADETPATPAPAVPAKFDVNAMRDEVARELSARAAPAAETPPPAPAAEPEKKMEVKPEVKEQPQEKPPSDSIARSFENLAKQKAELRAKEQAIAEKERRVSKLEALEAAAATRDPIAVLRAAGMSWSEATEAVVGLSKGGKKPEEPKADQTVSVVEKLQQEIAALRAEQWQKEQISNIGNALTKAPSEKFRLVKELLSPQDIYNQIAAHYSASGGQLPAETFEDSVQMVMEAMEVQLKQQAERFSKVLGLTAPSTSPTVPEVKSVVPVGESDKPGSKPVTLTNNLDAAPRPVAPTNNRPRTAEDYQREAIAALEELKKREA